jgi:hypothetical protein
MSAQLTVAGRAASEAIWQLSLEAINKIKKRMTINKFFFLKIFLNMCTLT